MVQPEIDNRTYYIRHTQRVAFDVPVFCEPSIARLHPRLDDHGVVHWSNLEVTPRPVRQAIKFDRHDNTVWQLGFHDLTIGLTLTVTSCVELCNHCTPHESSGNYAASLPASRYRRPHITVGRPIEALIQAALRASNGTQLSYLQRLTEIMASRLGIGPQPSATPTVDVGEVERRLLAAATECLANAGRAQGIPARIVRGYEAMTSDEIEIDTRLWVEFYLNDTGWVAFDPLTGMIESGDWIPLAKGATVHQTSPLSGIFRGSEHAPDCTTQIVIRQAAVPIQAS